MLLSAQTWAPSSLPALYSLLAAWPRPDTTDTLQLFLPTFPDSRSVDSHIIYLQNHMKQKQMQSK